MDASHLDMTFGPYRNRGLLIDTNLLLLYFVGEVDIKLISRFNRTKEFIKEDFFLLKYIVKFFDVLVTTPNILTEVSNLAGREKEYYKLLFYENFSKRLTVFREEYIESVQAVASEAFRNFGLTDSVIAELSKDKYLVLTTDFPLANWLQSKKIAVQNFNNLRPAVW